MRAISFVFAFILMSTTLHLHAESCDLSGSSCGAGQGCYARQVDDMFVDDPTRQVQYMESVENHLASNEPKPLDGVCRDDRDCESLSCKVINDKGDKRCVAEYVCRSPRAGEVLSSGVSCAEGLTAENNVCRPDNNAIYAGLPQISVEPVQTNVCEYEFPQDKYNAAIRAMYVMRAMEILFARASTANDSNECLKIAETLKPIGEDLAYRRKMLVRNFNQKWNEIEADIATIMSATNNTNDEVTLFGTRISPTEVERRKALGIDMLEIMRRRAVVQKQYESGMLLIYNDVAQKINTIETQISNFDENSSTWTIGNNTYDTKEVRACRARKFFKRYYFTELKYRSFRFYLVPRIQNILNSIKANPSTYQHLAEIYGSTATVDNKFLNDGPFSLLDPMWPDMNNQNPFGNYGLNIPLTKRLRFKLLFSVDNFMERFRTVTKEHLATFKDSGMVGADKFLYDPDLVKLSAKNCIDQSGNPNCSEFESFKEKISQIVYAQFLGFSHHRSMRFTSYFAVADSGIRKTIADIRASLATAENFYDAMRDYRDQQINCLETQIRGVENNFMGIGGLADGNVNNFANQPGTKPIKSGAAQAKTLTLAENKKWDNGLSSTMLSYINSDNKLNNYTHDKQNGNVSLTNEAREAMAARLKTMQETNKKSVAAGKNLKQAEELIQKSIKSTNAANAVANLNNGLSSLKSAVTKNIPSPAPGIEQSGSSSLNSSLSPSKNSSPAPTNNQSAISGEELSNGTTSADPSGMTEEEKNQMMANYDRTKGEYKAKEEDGLFKILSKAYVRSLDKVLKRKKPGED